MKTLKRLVLCVAVAVVLLASANGTRANPDVYDKVLTSTGLILVPQGEGKGDMQGTCWVVDHERKLVITNNHVVGDKKEVFVYFPMVENGEVNPLRDAHLKAGRKIAGEVLHRDVKRDLALVRLEKLPANAQALTLAAKSSRPGETLHSVGNSGYNSGLLWRYTRGQVRSVAPYTLSLPTGTINAMVIETQGPINRGDSGGPLVNDRGDLVGVVSAFDTKDRLITWNIDVREVRTFLANADRIESAQVTQGR